MTGIALVTLSQSGGVASQASGWRLVWGLMLAGLAAICASWQSYRFELGKVLSQSEFKNSPDTADAKSTELACVLAMSVVTNVPGILGSLLIGLSIFPGKTGPGTFLGGLVSLAIIPIIVVSVVTASGNILFRYANLETKNLGVNAMQYLRPVLSLVWLGSFTTVTVYRTDFLWIGAASVIAVNALINFRSEERAGFKWLIVSLLGFGFAVYMRDEWFDNIPGYGLFPAFGDYYSVLGASVTVFVLILSFRTSRLNSRTISEEQQTYSLYRALIGLADSEGGRQAILRHVRNIDKASDIIKLKSAYKDVSRLIDGAGLKRSESARLLADLDTLVASKQRGRNMAELIVLVMLAFVVTGMAVFARTETAAWPALLNDIISMILASVVTFMTIHLFDQRSERDNPIITRCGSVVFLDATRNSEQNPIVERTISVVIGFAIVGIYIYLMAIKWLPI